MTETREDYIPPHLRSSAAAVAEICSYGADPETKSRVDQFWRDIADIAEKKRSDGEGGSRTLRNKFGKEKKVGRSTHSNAALVVGLAEALNDVAYADRRVCRIADGEEFPIEKEEVHKGERTNMNCLKAQYLNLNSPCATEVILEGRYIKVFSNDLPVLEISRTENGITAKMPFSTENGNSIMQTYDDPRLFGFIREGIFWSDYHPL